MYLHYNGSDKSFFFFFFRHASTGERSGMLAYYNYFEGLFSFVGNIFLD